MNHKMIAAPGYLTSPVHVHVLFWSEPRSLKSQCQFQSVDALPLKLPWDNGLWFPWLWSEQRRGRRLRVSRRWGVLSNTRKNYPHFTDTTVVMAIVSACFFVVFFFFFTRGANCSITHIREEERRLCAQAGDMWGRGFQYTVYSECIVTCICCQVLLNYIFVCNVETDVSFLYGGTTGSEQSNL